MVALHPISTTISTAPPGADQRGSPQLSARRPATVITGLLRHEHPLLLELSPGDPDEQGAPGGRIACAGNPRFITGLKNSLQLISSLIRMRSAKVSAPETRRARPGNPARPAGRAEIHSLLQDIPPEGNIDLVQSVGNLCQHLRSTYHADISLNTSGTIPLNAAHATGLSDHHQRACDQCVEDAGERPSCRSLSLQREKTCSSRSSDKAASEAATLPGEFTAAQAEGLRAARRQGHGQGLQWRAHRSGSCRTAASMRNRRPLKELLRS